MVPGGLLYFQVQFGGLRPGWDQFGAGTSCHAGKGWRCAEFYLQTRCSIRAGLVHPCKKDRAPQNECMTISS